MGAGPNAVTCGESVPAARYFDGGCGSEASRGSLGTYKLIPEKPPIAVESQRAIGCGIPFCELDGPVYDRWRGGSRLGLKTQENSGGKNQ